MATAVEELPSYSESQMGPLQLRPPRTPSPSTPPEQHQRRRIVFNFFVIQLEPHNSYANLCFQIKSELTLCLDLIPLSGRFFDLFFVGQLITRRRRVGGQIHHTWDGRMTSFLPHCDALIWDTLPSVRPSSSLQSAGVERQLDNKDKGGGGGGSTETLCPVDSVGGEMD